MNEVLRHVDSGEKLNLDINVEKNLQETKERAELANEFSGDQIEQIRRSIENKAVSGKEIPVGETDTTPAGHSFATHKELKAASYKLSLRHIQSRLHGPEKKFSKVIHKPTIEHLSTFGAQTLARPMGIMTAGATALVGSSLLLYFAKRLGFTYNFTVFLLLLAGGYVLGLVFELVTRLLKRRRS